ncbi:MAG TPA: DNA-binding protein WhiA [Bacilli bacterium]|nr:DNA-binding protein WhiA [Bacilli bacterium]
MSFTSVVKNEVSKLNILEIEKIAELSAIIHNSEISLEHIKISTENASVARRIYSLIKELFNEYAKITVRKGYNYNKSLIYILEINNHVEKVLDGLAIKDNNNILDIPKTYIIDDMDTMRAYMRGLFLINGSINDPKKSRYHLEFLVDNEAYANFMMNNLNEFYLNSKVIKRDNKYMIYIKEAEKIGDFLRIINATSALLYYEDIRIYRDHKNMTNRLNNMEQANVDKIIETGMKQVEEIEKIKSIGGLDLLDEKVKEVAIYRLKYPEVSLVELSEIITMETGNKITKSGLYHRLKKISQLAEKIK